MCLLPNAVGLSDSDFSVFVSAMILHIYYPMGTQEVIVLPITLLCSRLA